MPFYEYRCRDCDESFTLLRPMTERDQPAECPECGRTADSRKLAPFATSTGPGTSSSASDCGSGFS